MSHAICSPSGAVRWMTCPGSVREERNYPESSSTYATLGTLIHEVAYEALLANEPPMSHPELMPEHLAIAKAYVNYVKAIPGFKFYEHRMRFNEYVWGTADAVIADGKILHVVDLKSGSGVKVTARQNPQLMIYALMALREFEFLYDIEEVQIHIAQPALDNFDVWHIDPQTLMDWEFELLAAVEKTQDPQAELNPSEKACQFCRAKYQCAARGRQAITAARESFALVEPNKLTLEQISKVLAHKKELNRWLDDAETYALQLAENGTRIPGFELTEGRSIRKYINGDAVAERLQASGINPALIYERNLLTLTAMEKLLGKKEFSELLGDLITKQPGKPVLAPTKDTRLTLQSAVESFADFT